MDPVLSRLVALRPMREPTTAGARAARELLEAGELDPSFEWIVELERKSGWAPHPSSFMPMAVMISNTAITEAEPKLFRQLRLRCLEAAFEGYALAVALTGVEVGSSRVDLQACKLEYSIVSPK